MTPVPMEDEIIGEGTEAVVRCVRTPTGPVAHKRYRPENRRSGFMMELALKDITENDQHLLRIFGGNILESGERETIMEYCSGGTLRDRLNRQGRIEARDTLVMVEQVARALATLHAHRYIHNDVKPENVFMRSRSGPLHFKLGDYGQVTSANAPMNRRIGATRAYLAPERLRGVVTRKSDIYSLAVMWHECLSGERIRDAAEIARQFSGEERKVLVCCLSHDPTERPDAASLVREIQKMRSGQHAHDYVDSSVLTKLKNHFLLRQETANA